MRQCSGLLGMLAVISSLQSVCALAADTVPIRLTNDGPDDIIISVYDMNTNPRGKLLSHQKINGFATIPIAVSPGADGSGHVYWRAVTADPDLRKCGRKDKPGLANDATVHVYAKSDCPAS